MREWLIRRILEKFAGVPGVLEIVWSVQGLKRRILNADNSSRRRQHGIGRAKRQLQDDVAALIATRHIHFEARESGAHECVADQTGLNDPPKRAPAWVGDGGLR